MTDKPGVVVAAVAQFHQGLWLTVFASTDPQIIGLFAKPEFLALPASAMVRPGEQLLNLVPAPPSSAAQAGR